LERNPLEISKVKQRGVDFDINFETLQCASEVKEIELNEIDNFETVQFIDVREPHELPKLLSSNLIQIPLSQLEANLDVINTEKRTVMVCQSGIRSKKAVALVQQHNLINCVSLKVGACALANALKP
jgi:adenylyltransferase/sulfurtransferase